MEENRNQEVWEVKGKTPNVDDLSHNDSVAAVKEISVTDVSQGTNRRWEGGICTKLTSLNLWLVCAAREENAES
ncbi:hypothetical protein L1987_51111 [Smallanthus sonchifolius]|uniref:Uncharacterized protein n=1 Tax=Smallanthus sonchifolius TaxID=185202 RepID=A0ACB9EPE6_9ASTR|nr:hypothetical protein L1987_51111 [Smallanthus sonchifolius]